MAVVCLVLGGVLATRLDDEVATRRAGDGPAVSLRAGDLEGAVPCRRRCLRLPLFNAGHQPVTVTEVGFDDWRVRAHTRAQVLQPGTWGKVRFGLPDCSSPVPMRYRYVHVQTHAAGVPRVRTLRMPSATPLMQEEYARTCPVGRPVTPRELRGVWLLASSRGAWHSLSGMLLLRYGDNGAFAWDDTGHLLDPAHTADGRYRLAGRMLTMRLNNQNACHTGDVFRWRVTMTARDELHLQSVRDPRSYCGSADDEVWVVRRILDDDEVPAIGAAR